MARFRTIDVTIANAGTISAAVSVGDLTPVAIIMPATWTSAVLTFSMCPTSGGTFNDLYDGVGAGAEYTLTVAASRRVAIDPQMFLGVGFLKVRSGTGGSTVAQGGARTLSLVCRDLS